MVIVGPGERVVRNLRLADLMTAAEIEDQRDRTAAADWWYRGILFDYSIDETELRVRLRSGRVIQIALHTGEIIPT